nr:MAG TPA: hypothetical protein [Caudoviricetes sp.]
MCSLLVFIGTTRFLLIYIYYLSLIVIENLYLLYNYYLFLSIIF